ncbi:MAG: carboxymuconolactone decarboxylase family protein [Chloroflexi bacterium]|nr:carboxymuconolactone decarboxylase family protein [Chloroflexota bacterium]
MGARISSAVPGQTANFGTAFQHVPELAERFRYLYGTMWQEGVLDHPTKELARMRCARVNGCHN